jgi:hypothetical protein
MPRGRVKGSTNFKRTEIAGKLLRERVGEQFDPLALMTENAIKLHEVAQESNDRQDLDSAINALEKVTSYVHPQLKAQEIDLSSADGSMSPPRLVKLIAVYDDPEGRVAELEHDVDRLTEAVEGSLSDDSPDPSKDSP